MPRHDAEEFVAAPGHGAVGVFQAPQPVRPRGARRCDTTLDIDSPFLDLFGGAPAPRLAPRPSRRRRSTAADRPDSRVATSRRRAPTAGPAPRRRPAGHLGTPAARRTVRDTAATTAGGTRPPVPDRHRRRPAAPVGRRPRPRARAACPRRRPVQPARRSARGRLLPETGRRRPTTTTGPTSRLAPASPAPTGTAAAPPATGRTAPRRRRADGPRQRRSADRARPRRRPAVRAAGRRPGRRPPIRPPEKAPAKRKAKSPAAEAEGQPAGRSEEEVKPRRCAPHKLKFSDRDPAIELAITEIAGHLTFTQSTVTAWY